MQYEESITNWLHRRKISDATLAEFGILSDNRITIPVADENGVFLFNKYRRNPFAPDLGPKYWYDKGQRTALFGLHLIKDKPQVVITEGELDALVLWSHNIPAVSSTGGALSFQEEWVPFFKDKEVFICYDNDKAGGLGAVRTLRMIPHARVILLPENRGVKDVSDFYERNGDFRNLMAIAKHYVEHKDVVEDRNQRKSIDMGGNNFFHDEWLKWWDQELERRRWEDEKLGDGASPQQGDDIVSAKRFPIQQLLKFNYQKKALCPFHNEKTPSLHLFPDNHTYCFSCGKYADSIEIVRATRNLDFKSAVMFLNGA